MSILTVMRAYLLTSATLTGYIASRLYYMNAPQETVKPYVVYYILDDPNMKTMVGKDGADPILTFRIVVATGATGAATLEGISEAIRAKINDYTGLITGTNIYRIECVNIRDLPPDADNDYLERYCDYRIIYER
jgi:hypothetical protein